MTELDYWNQEGKKPIKRLERFDRIAKAENWEGLFAESTITETIDQRIENLQNTEAETKGQHNVRAAKINELKKLKKEFQ